MSRFDTPQSVLIVKTHEIGDVLLATPVAQAIREAYPTAHLAWFIEERLTDLVQGNPFLDQVIVMERKKMRQLRRDGRWREFLREAVRLRNSLRERTWDYLIDLQGLRRSVSVHLLARAKRRVLLPGWAKWDHYGPYLPMLRPRVHAIDYHLRAVRDGGISIPAAAPPMQMTFGAEHILKARSLLKPLCGFDRIAAVHPISARSIKDWPADRIITLGRKLIAETNTGVAILGAPYHGEGCKELVEQIGPGALSIAGGTSLKDLAAVLSACSVLITNDSGPMHLAAALNVPTLSLFGPSHPANYAHPGERNTVLYQGQRYTTDSDGEERPGTMEEIGVDLVFENARLLLEKPNLMTR